MKGWRIIPIILIVWPYLICLIFSNILGPLIGQVYFTIYFLLLPVVLLVNILFACLRKDGSAVYDLAHWNMVIKLAHIPFYLAVFVIGIFVPLGIIFLFIFDAVLMLTSSSYGISALVRAYKQGSITINFLVVNLVCHLLFVTDVISAIVVKRKMKKLQT